MRFSHGGAIGFLAVLVVEALRHAVPVVAWAVPVTALAVESAAATLPL